jgi:ABC-type transport system involved in multi-copper enzyme maturation permease subunit
MATPTKTTPGLLSSALRVFDLSLGEMLWSRRTIFMALVVGAPVVISVILRLLDAIGAPVFRVNGMQMAGPTVFGMMIWFFYLRFTVPVLGVFYGTSLIADEVEDKTITYLFTRPVRKGAVLLGKYFAYIACTVFVVMPSVVIVYLCIVPMRGGALGGSFLDLVKDLLLLSTGLAVYGAVFAAIGARFKRPLLVGLIFIFGWEQVALAFPGYLKRFTVAYYLQSLVPHAMPNDNVVSLIQSFFRENISLGQAVFWLLTILLAFLWVAAVSVERKEYVLEQ